jgi:1,4-dihydroxy-2-naphthoate octaprenyltransferase
MIILPGKASSSMVGTNCYKMNNSQRVSISLLIRFSRPWSLLAGMLASLLGMGINDYLGGDINWLTGWVGMACILLLQFSSYWLKVYFDPPDKQNRYPRPRSIWRKNDDDPQPGLPRQLVLQASITTLTIGAVLTVLLLANHSLNATAFLLLGLSFLMAFLYAVPPARLVYSGYGELAEAIIVCNLAPAFALSLQTGEIHRLLAMLTFPLTPVYLALSIILSLPGYVIDEQRLQRNLLVRLGWQKAMSLHNILVFCAFLLVGLASIMGLPWVLAWPLLLPLPVGLFQIWNIIQISRGAPTRWRLTILASTSLLGIMLYLANLALWTR